jgi:hypothetical protein
MSTESYGRSDVKVYTHSDFESQDELGAGSERVVYKHPDDPEGLVLKIRLKEGVFPKIREFMCKIDGFFAGMTEAEMERNQARTLFYGMRIIEVLFPGRVPHMHYIAGDHYENICTERVDPGILSSSLDDVSESVREEISSLYPSLPCTTEEYKSRGERKHQLAEEFVQNLKECGIQIDANPSGNNFNDEGVYWDGISSINWKKLKHYCQKLSDIDKKKEVLQLIECYEREVEG